MPEGDHPRLRVGGEIALEPREHRAGRRAVRLERVEADEMDVGVVERVVRLGPRGDAARLALFGSVKMSKYGPVFVAASATVSIVVAERRPQRRSCAASPRYLSNTAAWYSWSSPSL